MAKKDKDLKGLISQAKIYARIEEKHQKLMKNLQQHGITLENKPIDEVEKSLSLTMQRLGMNLEEYSSVKQMALHYDVLPQKK